jgi:DNA (cytosine-5)-methyltransferase 1
MKVVSLFANIGIAEAYLESIGFEVVLANEIIPRRIDLYSQIYKNCKTICGDLSNKKIFKKTVDEALKFKVDVVMAAPPCQGMSTAGQLIENDIRNNLIVPTLKFINKTSPKYIFIENVPKFLKTSIGYKNKDILIPDLIKKELDNSYEIQIDVVDTQNYSVPQVRERAIILMTRKDVRKKWHFPRKEKNIATIKDVIGHLPTLDPFIKDVSKEELLKFFPKFEERKKKALQISKWHYPPHHVKRQVVAMMHTPTGKSAFDNIKYKPIKENGKPVKGFLNTYKRQHWNRPAYTITMDNVKISSQNNVHPGKLIGRNSIGDKIYSDARTLTLYELMKLMTLPDNWALPEKTSIAFVRRIIGEGIPPLFVKKIFSTLM